MQYSGPSVIWTPGYPGNPELQPSHAPGDQVMVWITRAKTEIGGVVKAGRANHSLTPQHHLSNAVLFLSYIDVIV